MNKPVSIAYFSDILCIWAYISQIRLDELQQNFGQQIHIDYHFIPVFGCTEQRIAQGWKDRGGFAGFNQHIQSVCEQFPHISVHTDIWLKNPPTTSATSHLFLKAVQLVEKDAGLTVKRADSGKEHTWCESLSLQIREAFFQNNRDISNLKVLFEIAEQNGLAAKPVEEQLNSGKALAALCRDLELRDQFHIQGSPTFVMNEARQKLYGNVGYRILEANVQELLQNPGDRASWC